jgi:tetratricopeptide (TPR) repeat protein
MTTTDVLHQKLGQAFAFHQAGRLADAEPLYREILDVAPAHFDSLHMLGVLHLQTQRNAEALALITRAVAVNPASATALNNQGNALRVLGRYDEALVSYERALAADASYIEAIKNRGDVYQILGKHTEAIACYDQALSAMPQHAEALNNRGASLQHLKKIDEALADYERALLFNPRHILALKNRGKALAALGRHEDALKTFAQALTIDANAADTYAYMGGALRALKRTQEAMEACDKALSLNPNEPQALNVRGALLRDMHRCPEAIACFDKAIALKPDHIEAIVNRGTALHELGRAEEAITAFDHALAINPEHPEAHWNRALTLLMTERFTEGWQEYDWRMRCRSIPTRTDAFTQPRWDGGPLTQGSLLIWGEQGVGDEIFYAGMVDDLLARGLSLVWEADARLMPLIARSYPNIKAVPRATPPAAATQDPAISAQISIASLGQFLRRDLSAFPKDRRGYLKADPLRMQAYKAQLSGHGAKRTIGVSWISKNPDFGAHKSSRLTDWAPLWKNAGPDTRFVDLQYGDTRAERAALPFDLTHIEGLDTFNDLDGLAALISACDLVITVSNTTTHLAGALGVPAWVLLPKGNGKLWYWGAERTGSLWYPSATIFRQETPDDWSGVIAHIAGRLAESP